MGERRGAREGLVEMLRGIRLGAEGGLAEIRLVRC